MAAKRVGSSGKVFAFEPSPFILPKLKCNIKLNKLDIIQLYELAVADKKGVLNFYMPIGFDISSGHSSFRSIGYNCQKVEVFTSTIDSYLDFLPEIKLVKIDIEGAEVMALKGMFELIKRDKPHFIIEVTNSFLTQLGSSAKELFEILLQFDYNIFDLGGKKLSIDNIDVNEQYNIFCIHKTKDTKDI